MPRLMLQFNFGVDRLQLVYKDYAKVVNYKSDIQSLELEALINLLWELDRLNITGVIIKGVNKNIIDEINSNPISKRSKLASLLIRKHSHRLKWFRRQHNKEAHSLAKRAYNERLINTRNIAMGPNGQYCTLLKKCRFCKEEKFYQEFPTRRKNKMKRDSRCFECISKFQSDYRIGNEILN